MERTVEATSEDFATVRTGRANPAMYSKVLVDYYGAATPLQQLASFATPDARTILITPYDASSLRDIEKALSDSEIGANPSNDGKQIRITMPDLTEERSREHGKHDKGKGRNRNVTVRNTRRKDKGSNENSVKVGDVSEKEGDRAVKDLEALTNSFTDRIDEMVKRKDAGLLEV